MFTSRLTPKTLHGRYVPINPHKYRGNIGNIVFRSSWELKFCRKCDISPIILEWALEPIGIPYYNPIKGRMAKYYVDFWIKYRNNNNQIIEAFVEVKPESQTKPPTKKTKFWRDKMSTYMINESKWKAAKKLCETKGIQFFIVTEKFINSL